MEVSIREIKFRGKRLDNGEWVCGCLTRYSNHMSYITVDLIENEVHEASTATVGQYVGLKGSKGFDGDIILAHQRGDNDKQYPLKLAITYLNGCFMVGNCTTHEFYRLYQQDFKIIGNIHDNPELLNAT